MTIEQARQEIISVFSEAGKGIHDWMEHLDAPDIQKLHEVSKIIRTVRETALARQQQKIR